MSSPARTLLHDRVKCSVEPCTAPAPMGRPPRRAARWLSGPQHPLQTRAGGPELMFTAVHSKPENGGDFYFPTDSTPPAWSKKVKEILPQLLFSASQHPDRSHLKPALPASQGTHLGPGVTCKPSSCQGHLHGSTGLQPPPTPALHTEPKFRYNEPRL